MGEAGAQIQRAGDQHRLTRDVASLDVLVERTVPRLHGADGQDESLGRVPEVRIVFNSLHGFGADPLDEGQPGVAGQRFVAAHGDDRDIVAACFQGHTQTNEGEDVAAAAERSQKDVHEEYLVGGENGRQRKGAIQGIPCPRKTRMVHFRPHPDEPGGSPGAQFFRFGLSSPSSVH